MTRKHYRTIATAIRANIDSSHTVIPGIRAIAESLATEFKSENPQFDRAVFLDACGL